MKARNKEALLAIIKNIESTSKLATGVHAVSFGNWITELKTILVDEKTDKEPNFSPVESRTTINRT